MWKNEAEQSIALRVEYVVEEDGAGFHAFAPAFKGLHADGNTRDEAIRNLVAGLQVYIESLVKHGDPLPIGPFLTQMEPEPEIPQGAFLGSVTLQWPSLQTSGIS